MGLREYVMRRIGQLILTYWAFITILFVLFRIMPGDPTSMYAEQGLDAAARREIIEDLGLNEPLHIQYIEYMGQVLSGDFGYSFIYREPVADIIFVRFWNTIFLMAGALLIAYTIGVLGGALLAWWRGTNFEKGGIIIALMARSSPEFWSGIIVLSIFVFWLGWFPSGGMRTAGAEIAGFWDRYFARDFVYHLAMPVLTGAIYYMATPTLLMRNSMLDVLNEDYIEMKDAEGIPKMTILYKHAARNSILPIVTVIATGVGAAVGGSLVIETVFNWPGMGREMVRAINYNDYPVAMAAFFLMGSLIIWMNFIADLLYVYLDPRVKYD